MPHVHAHIIPRKYRDLGDGPEAEDKVYELMQGNDADLWRAFREREGRFPVPEGERKPRSEKEMREEAEWLMEKIRELEEKEKEGGRETERL